MATGLLPLAVYVGGLRLAAMRFLPLRDFADRLAGPRTVLDELAVDDLSARPRTSGRWYTEAGTPRSPRNRRPATFALYARQVAEPH